MPSVFFVSLMSASPWGGSEELWLRTAQLALQRGWKVGCAVYHWPAKEQRLQPLLEKGAAVYYLPNKGRSKKNLLEKLQNKISKARIPAVVQQLPFEQYDMVVVNMGAFEITMPAWQNLPDRLQNYIVLYHNYKEREVFHGAKRTAIAKLADKAQLNLFASSRIAEVLQKNSGIHINRGGILLNPISFPIPAAPAPYPETGSARFVMLAALETDRKAQDQLIKALSTPEWQSRDWSLRLYGEGRDKSLLQSLIREHGLEQRIFLEGHTSDVAAALTDAHMLLQLTHQDAMPLSVVEAMAIGRPLAVSAVGDMPQWVEENVNGFVSGNASAAAISDTLEKAWASKSRWMEMGKQAFETFRKKFTREPEELLLDQITASITGQASEDFPLRKTR